MSREKAGDVLLERATLSLLGVNRLIASGSPVTAPIAFGIRSARSCRRSSATLGSPRSCSATPASGPSPAIRRSPRRAGRRRRSESRRLGYSPRPVIAPPGSSGSGVKHSPAVPSGLTCKNAPIDGRDHETRYA